MAGTAIVGVITVIVVAIVTGGNDSDSNPPRFRTEVPGLDSEIDLFADESDGSDPNPNESAVTVIDGIDPIQTAFVADDGRPRLILLVDPI